LVVGSTFVEIDHSGDIGIEAWGADLAELIEQLTLGLFSLMCRGNVEQTVERKLSVESQSLEDAVVDWLSEVIATVGTCGEVYGGVAVKSSGAYRIEGLLKGEPIRQEKHRLRFDVKAATYHDLLVEPTDNGHHARVIFDL
jgi:SHS2 domain-containing protein